MDWALAEPTGEKIPPLLEDILKRTLNVEKSTYLKQTDVFLVLIIVLLTENGFILMSNDTVELQCLQHIDNDNLTKWKTSTGAYEVTFTMTGFNETLIKLVLCPLGSSALINVVISDIKPDVYSVCLSVNRYIILNPDAPTISMMFHDLKHLSDTLKNNIITPVKSTILNYYGYSGASLVGLPEELIYTILLYLPVFDIISVAKTCKKLSLLLNNESFWHKLFLRDFSNTISTDCQEWKKRYRNMYTTHQESLHKERSLRGTLHDLMDVSDYVSYIDNPMWDDFI